MAYEWTKEQIAQLTVGCAVMAEIDVTGEAEPREIARVYNVTRRGTFTAKCTRGLVMVSDEMDPSTLQPPTLATLNRLAVEAFGEGAFVYVSYDCELTVQHDASDFVASFCSVKDHGATAARECAWWLAARGKP